MRLMTKCPQLLSVKNHLSSECLGFRDFIFCTTTSLIMQLTYPTPHFTVQLFTFKNDNEY